MHEWTEEKKRALTPHVSRVAFYDPEAETLGSAVFVGEVPWEGPPEQNRHSTCCALDDGSAWNWDAVWPYREHTRP